jgi:hypothetical protein
LNGATLTVLGNLTLRKTDPDFNAGMYTGKLDARGNVTMSNWSGGDAALSFSGTGTQNFTRVTGILPGGTVTVSKPSGAVVLMSSTVINSAGQDLEITSGTFSLNGYELVVNDVMTVGAGGNLQLNGDETITHTSSSVVTGSSFTYVGTMSTQTLKNYPYSNLTINGGASTIFTPPHTYSLNNLTIASGILNVSGLNLTAAGTFSNNGTLRLRGDETITLSGNDVDSGTWDYVGNGDGSTDNYTVKDFGGTDYYNLVLTSTNTADNFKLNGALTLAGALTISSSTLNTQVATNTITIAGNWSKTTNATFTNNNTTVTFNGAIQ